MVVGEPEVRCPPWEQPTARPGVGSKTKQRRGTGSGRAPRHEDLGARTSAWQCYVGPEQVAPTCASVVCDCLELTAMLAAGSGEASAPSLTCWEN